MLLHLPCVAVPTHWMCKFASPFTQFLVIPTVSPSGSVSFLATTNGNMVTLSCSAQGGPGNTFSITHSGVEQSATSTLVVDTTDPLVGGLYQCEVTNAAGSDSATASVNSKLPFSSMVCGHSKR